MPKYLFEAIKNHKKRLIFFWFITIIFHLFSIGRFYFFGLFFHNLLEVLKWWKQELFINSIIIIWVVECFHFIIWIAHQLIHTKSRWYLNIYFRTFWIGKIIDINYNHLAKFGSWKLLQILHNWVTWYSNLIFIWFIRSTEIIIHFWVMIVTLTYFNYLFLVFFVVAFFILILFQKIVYNKLTTVRERERELNENYTKQTAKILMNFILLKVYWLKEKEIQTLTNIWISRVKNFVKLKFWFSWVSRWFMFFVIVLLLISLWYFWKLFLNWTIGFDVVMAVFMLVLISNRTLYRLWEFLWDLPENFTYIQKYDEILEKSNEVIKSKEIEKNNLKYDIIMQNLSYIYESSETILFDNFNLTIPYWSKTAIIWRSWSWKSTLFKFMTRLLETQDNKSQILFKNKKEKINIKDLSYKSIYKSVWYFYQDPLVFDGTVRENLSLNMNFPDEKLLEILKICYLDNLKLETIIWENWVLLSWWEKQRIALSRAFLFDYDIILLDEPTSNLDQKLEKEVLLKIFEKYKNKTIIIVSHRPFILKYVDRVIEMKKWEIVVDGEYT